MSKLEEKHKFWHAISISFEMVSLAKKGWGLNWLCKTFSKA